MAVHAPCGDLGSEIVGWEQVLNGTCARIILVLAFQEALVPLFYSLQRTVSSSNSVESVGDYCTRYLYVSLRFFVFQYFVQFRDFRLIKMFCG